MEKIVTFTSEFNTSYPTMYIYKLIDPLTNEICYVGLTDNPTRRYREHCARPGMFKGNAMMCKWIVGLSEIGERPIMIVIDRIDDCFADEGKNAERDLIKEYWRDGHPLLNRERWMFSRRNIHGWRDRLNGAFWYIERGAGKFIIA